MGVVSSGGSTAHPHHPNTMEETTSSGERGPSTLDGATTELGVFKLRLDAILGDAMSGERVAAFRH